MSTAQVPLPRGPGQPVGRATGETVFRAPASHGGTTVAVNESESVALALSVTL